MKRPYFPSGFFRRTLTDEESEMVDTLYAAFISENPDLAESTLWRVQVECLARDIVLEARCPPPRTPNEDNGMKVSVSRSKIVLARIDQLGLSRKQRQKAESGEKLEAFLREFGNDSKAKRALRRVLVPDDTTAIDE